MSELDVSKTMGAAQKLTPLGSSILTLGGLSAAFSVAACCALPLLLSSVGVGAVWLSSVALTAAPLRNQLLAMSALALAGGAVLLWRQQRTAAACSSAGCVSLSLRVLTIIGLLLGAGLLWAGYTYA